MRGSIPHGIKGFSEKIHCAVVWIDSGLYGGNHMADKIQNAYEASKNIYDDVLTQGNFFSRLYIKMFWSGTDDTAIARKVLSYIPDDFSGNLLDVPKKRSHHLS